MPKKILILIPLIMVINTQLSFADNVKIKSSQEGTLLPGIMTKPQGDGPFPAVVLLHGCGGHKGSWPRTESWSKRLVGWGYVTLAVDSFEPRNMSNICSDMDQLNTMGITRAQDAYDAKDFLSKLPFVNRHRIALLGWSHGGVTVLTALIKQIKSQNRESPFKAAVAFYPYCDIYLNNLNAPLLILIGESDDWTPAKSCSASMPTNEPEPEVILKIYPGAYHDFDWEGMDKIYEGHIQLYDPIAAQDAIVQVKNFLAKYLM